MEQLIKSLTDFYIEKSLAGAVSTNELTRLYNEWKQRIPYIIEFETFCVLSKYLQDLNNSSPECVQTIRNI